jgi:hypothetical protein
MSSPIHHSSHHSTLHSVIRRHIKSHQPEHDIGVQYQRIARAPHASPCQVCSSESGVGVPWDTDLYFSVPSRGQDKGTLETANPSNPSECAQICRTRSCGRARSLHLSTTFRSRSMSTGGLRPLEATTLKDPNNLTAVRTTSHSVYKVVPRT